MRYISTEDINYFRNLQIYIFYISILLILSISFASLYTHDSVQTYILRHRETNITAYINEKSDSLFSFAFGDDYLAGLVIKLPAFLGFLDIFLNNVKSGFLITILGVYGLIPLISTIMNGSIIGYFSVIESYGSGFLFVLSFLIPHGIIEIPAYIITSSIGLRIGSKMTKSLFKCESIKDQISVFCLQKDNLYSEYKIGVIFYVKYVIPLFLLASLIEFFLSKKIAYLIIGK
jgi:uncharacterized membrane protein SpoIIM required for sporulation